MGFGWAMGRGFPPLRPSCYNILRQWGRRASTRNLWTYIICMTYWIGTGVLKSFRCMVWAAGLYILYGLQYCSGHRHPPLVDDSSSDRGGHGGIQHVGKRPCSVFLCIRWTHYANQTWEAAKVVQCPRKYFEWVGLRNNMQKNVIV